MADNPPTEIQALIDSHINAFNTQNVELFLSVLATTPSSSMASPLIAG